MAFRFPSCPQQIFHETLELRGNSERNSFLADWGTASVDLLKDS